MGAAFLALLAAAAGVLAGPAAASSCGGPSLGRTLGYNISGCGDGEPVCPLHRGRTAEVKVAFVPDVAIDRLQVRLHGLVLGFPIPFHLSNEDACRGSGLRCPLAAGARQVFATSVPIKSFYPPMGVKVKLQLTDPATQMDVVCELIDTRLV